MGRYRRFRYRCIGLRRGRPGRYVPDSSVTSSVPSGMLNPIQPMPYFSPPPGVTPTSLGTSPSAAPQFFSPMSSPTDSTLYGDPQQQQQHPQAQLPAKTPAALDSSVPRGWNDPPPPSASRKCVEDQQWDGDSRCHVGHSGDKKLMMLKQRNLMTVTNSKKCACIRTHMRTQAQHHANKTSLSGLQGKATNKSWSLT
ncbi:hypothetical protein E2C01_040153 [Portunus trituberculatus]|uniref:Uncharacterized protein n=1 Tax=Portunus trituberculatus TaxID=210409 RepID=A0A5B7FMV6_PORTR|nr:hypothetical protein [Portunus trituberculatus]